MKIPSLKKLTGLSPFGRPPATGFRPGNPPVGKPPAGKPPKPPSGTRDSLVGGLPFAEAADSKPQADKPATGKFKAAKVRDAKAPSGPGTSRSVMRHVSIGLLVLGSLGLVVSLVVTLWPQVLWAWPVFTADAAFFLMRQLPIASAALAVVAGILCMVFAPVTVIPAIEQPTTGDVLASSGLLGVVRELETVLAGEQGKAAALQEAYQASAREARSMTAHVARLAEASREAEIRLSSSVERANLLLSQAGSGEAPTPEALERADRVPMEISEIILRRITEQTRVIGLTLDDAIGKMAAETDNTVQAFRAAVTGATAQITALGDSAVDLKRDAAFMETAGREIATAGATMMARFGGTVSDIEAALSHLPQAAAAVTSAAEQAGQTLAEASAVLCADSAAIEASVQETRQTAELLQQQATALGTMKQALADTGQAAIASVVQTVETATAHLATTLTDAGTEAARQAATALSEQAAELIRQEATALDATKQALADAGQAAIAAVVQTVGTATAHLATTLTDSGNEAARQAATALSELIRQEATALDTTKQALAEAGQAAIAAVMQTVETATAHLTTTITDAGNEAARQAATSLSGQAAELIRQEAAALGSARQAIADTGESAAQTVDTAIARLVAAGEADASASTQRSAQLTIALEQVADRLTQSSGVLAVDSAASGRDIRQAVDLLQQEAAALGSARQEIADAGAAAGQAVETATTRLASVIAHVDGVRQGSADLAAVKAELERVTTALVSAASGVSKVSEVLGNDSTALDTSVRASQEAAETIQRETAALGGVRQFIADAGAWAAQTMETAAGHLAALIAEAATVSRGSEGLGELTVSLERATAGLVNAASNVAEASAALCADSAAMEASGRETRQAAEILQREAAAIGAAGPDYAAIAGVSQTLQATAAQLAGMVANADDGTAGIELAARLEAAAGSIVEAVASLTSAGQRVSAAGTQVADHLATDISASKAVLATLPDVRAELTAAVADLRLETAVLTGAAQQISSAGTAATTAVTEAAVRVEIAATTLGAADRSIGASSAEAATQIDRLGGIAQQAETHMARLPGITGEIGATAARLEAATPALERLDTLSQRLESALAEPAAVAQEASVMTLISLSSDLCEAMRRVEASLSAHDSVLPAVASSMAQVEAAVGNVVSALSRPADLVPALDGEPTPAALAATLRRLDEVTSQTEALLQQTEALAEAVLNGRAPGLDALLADRTPVLLAGIDGMTKRMRSVATALALVNDGVPKAGNGLRRAG